MSWLARVVIVLFERLWPLALAEPHAGAAAISSMMPKTTEEHLSYYTCTRISFSF